MIINKETIKTQEKSTITLDLHLKYMQAYKTIRKIIKNKESVDFRLKGNVYYQTIFGAIKLPFDIKDKEKK